MLEAQFHPERIRDINDAYNAKEALDLAQKDIDKIKNPKTKETAQKALDDFINFAPEYTKKIVTMEKFDENQPELEGYCSKVAKERRHLHLHLREDLKNITHAIIKSEISDSQWRKFVEENNLSSNAKISLLAMNIHKYNLMQKELKRQNKKAA